MLKDLRTIFLFALLLAGIGYSLPIHSGRNVSDDKMPPSTVEHRPVFSLTARRDSLVLAAYTASAHHEARLTETLHRSFSGIEKRLEFQPFGMVPDWWDEVTAGLIHALEGSRSPSARLDENTLEVRAVVAAESSARERLMKMRDTLPSFLDVELNLLDPGPTVSAQELCQRQFAELESGPVKFEQSTTQMRSSAFIVLDRITALADACRHSPLLITGHTDSSGSEEWNRQLSLARAEAVARYLGERGIDPDRLIAAGAGSSVPVASNATRYGRSLNRRIEFEFSDAIRDAYSGDVRLTSSMSNNNVALGGTGGLPRTP